MPLQLYNFTDSAKYILRLFYYNHTIIIWAKKFKVCWYIKFLVIHIQKFFNPTPGTHL